MRPIKELLAQKRDGVRFSAGDLADLVHAIATKAMDEAQLGAFAMACVTRGLDAAETVALTRAMAASGTRIDWRAHGMERLMLDKHSTGGIGDTVSLILAPWVAAAGGAVPMIAGRGLGHTGGTIDKLEAIPGFRTDLPITEFVDTVARVGCAIIGQTADLAPADRRLYAARDATGTAESIALITASILSKKLAAGLDRLVMDVKCGAGAFMRDLDSARALARSLVTVANGAGLACRALITAMDQPLATCAGNAIEVREAIAVLRGERADSRLLALTRGLALDMLVAAGAGEADAAGLLDARLASGAALERFQTMVAGQGGPEDLVEHPDRHLPRAPCLRAVLADRCGQIAAIDTRALGNAVVALGGGRTRADDRIDPAVGLSDLLPIGAEVRPGAPIGLIHARDDDSAEAAAATLRVAYIIADAPSTGPLPLVIETVS